MAEPEFTSAELESEEWRPVAGYEGRYSVSSLGRIRGDDQAGNRQRAGRIIRPDFTGTRGYARIRLTHRRGRPRAFFLHRIVATAFLGHRPDGKQVNHKDGDRANNRASNLEWVTASENAIHSHSVLGSRVGEKHKWATLTNAQVVEIKQIFRENRETDAHAIARRYGVGHSAIYKIKYGKAWKYI